MQRVFRTKQPVIIYPSSGTGAWEAAIVNTLPPGDKVLMAETGQFAVLWRGIADKFKLDVDFIPGDWRHGADLEQIEARLVGRQGSTRSRRSASFTTRPRPAASPIRSMSARSSIASSIRRC